MKLAKEQRSAKAAGQATEDADDAEAGRAVRMAARPIGRPGDEEYKYELPDDDDGPVLTHRVARRVFMAGRFEPSARDEGGWDGGCAKCQEALALTIADQQAVVTHSMLPKPAHEHCHQCDTVARADEPGICPACAMPTEGTSGSESRMKWAQRTCRGTTTAGCQTCLLAKQPVA